MTKTKEFKSTRKTAIFYNEDALAFLNNATTRTNQVRTFLMLNYGLHPENLRLLTKGNLIIEGDTAVLTFRRAKNQKTRRELIPIEQARAIHDIIRRGRLKVGNRSLEYICEEQGGILTRYGTPPVSPMTLRHTYILNQLREHWGMDDKFHLVSDKAGCKPEIVRQNYLDLEQWEKIHKAELRMSLDLTEFRFMD